MNSSRKEAKTKGKRKQPAPSQEHNEKPSNDRDEDSRKSGTHKIRKIVSSDTSSQDMRPQLPLTTKKSENNLEAIPDGNSKKTGTGETVRNGPNKMLSGKALDTNSQDQSRKVQKIEILQEHGVLKADIDRLKAAGICTTKGLETATTKSLLTIKGFSEPKVERLKQMLQKVAGPRKFITSMELEEAGEEAFKISTGSRELDKILGGGIEAKTITEVHGENGSGKTQMAHTLSITAQVDRPGYKSGKAIVIDTERSFRIERLKDIAKRFRIDEKVATKNVLYARASTCEDIEDFLTEATALMSEELGAYRIIIIDSILSLFRGEYSVRELMERQQHLVRLMSRLQKLSEEYNLAIFITNHMEWDPIVYPDQISIKPVGGNIMGHYSTTRIWLKGTSGTQRIAKLIHSPGMPEAEAAIAITKGGVNDVGQ